MKAFKKRVTKSYDTFDKGVYYLSKLMTVINIDDLDKKELEGINLAFFEASKGMRRVHDIFISVLERNEREGNDLIKREEGKQLRKKILKK